MGARRRFEVRPDVADALITGAQLVLLGLLAVIVLVRVGWGG